MRIIFHCDIDNCFASIEAAMNPSLAGLPLAVCGDPAQRRGIVLAKSIEAKACGVSTGDPLWRAREKCPNIRFVKPHFEVYSQYSSNIRRYYSQYSASVEPFGLDECWLDVSSGRFRFVKEARGLAEKIQGDIRRIFGVTVSIGVSFNKVFAKLGSDLNKPNGIAFIDRHDFKKSIWGLDVSALLGVGRSTNTRLHRIGIYTIGQLAMSDSRLMQSQFGKNGVQLWRWANGWDESPVLDEFSVPERQSLGHGTTLPQDLWSLDLLWPVIESLSERIAFELQAEGYRAYGIQLMVRDRMLRFHQYQMKVSHGFESSRGIADYALMLLEQKYPLKYGVHGIGIRLYALEKLNEPDQLSLFESRSRERIFQEKQSGRTDRAIHQIQRRFGVGIIERGYQLNRPAYQPGFFPNAVRPRV